MNGMMGGIIRHYVENYVDEFCRKERYTNVMSSKNFFRQVLLSPQSLIKIE